MIKGILIRRERERAKRYCKKIVAELDDQYIIDVLRKDGIPAKHAKKYPLLMEGVRQYHLTMRLIDKITKDEKKKLLKAKDIQEGLCEKAKPEEAQTAGTTGRVH